LETFGASAAGANFLANMNFSVRAVRLSIVETLSPRAFLAAMNFDENAVHRIG
jgi:hypothetical protein